MGPVNCTCSVFDHQSVIGASGHLVIRQPKSADAFGLVASAQETNPGAARSYIASFFAIPPALPASVASLPAADG